MSENNPYSIDDDPPPPAYTEATECEKPAKDSGITHQNPMPFPGMMPMAGGKVAEPGTNPPPVPQPYPSQPVPQVVTQTPQPAPAAAAPVIVTTNVVNTAQQQQTAAPTGGGTYCSNCRTHVSVHYRSYRSGGAWCCLICFICVPIAWLIFFFSEQKEYFCTRCGMRLGSSASGC